MATFGSISGTNTGAGNPGSAGGSSTSGRSASIAPNDCNVPSAGNDGISSLNFSPTSNVLVSTNWDAGIRCWDVQFDQPSGQIRANPQAQGRECLIRIN